MLLRQKKCEKKTKKGINKIKKVSDFKTKSTILGEKKG